MKTIIFIIIAALVLLPSTKLSSSLDYDNFDYDEDDYVYEEEDEYVEDIPYSADDIMSASDISEDATTYNGHTYVIYEDCDTWEEARDVCEEIGGHLVTIEDQEENDFLYEYINSVGYKSAYIGYYLDLSDGEENAEWRWVTDEDIDYENFYETEPNRENPGEIYAMFYYKFTDGTWNDGDFGHKTNSGGKAYICEWDD